MAGTGDQVPGYRRPHEDTRPAAAIDGPREALGRLELPVVGPLDLELALAAPLRLALDAEALELDPGSALLARLPDLPPVELRRTRLDLVHGTVTADADAIGPFLFTAAGVALRIALRRGFGWHPGRSVLEFLAQNLPADPESRARRVFHGPLGASAWLPPDARLVAELRGDRVEVVLSRPAVLRVLGLALPILAVRLLFGPARLEIDPGPTGPVRRAILRLAAWVASRWLGARLPAAMTIPGYDLFADEQRRVRLADLVRRLRGQKRPRRAPRRRKAGPGGEVPADMSVATGPLGHAPADMPDTPGPQVPAPGDLSRASGLRARLADIVPRELHAGHPPLGARVLARISLGARGELALIGDRELLVTRAAGGARFEAPGGLYVHADELPELAELRLVRALLVAAPAAPPGAEPRVRLELQTDPPLGPLMRALIRRVVDARVIPRLSPALLARLGLVGEREADELLLLDQPFGPRTGVRLTADADAEVRVRHGGDALVVEAPAGLRLRFQGLPVLPDADIHRLEYRWHDGSVVAEATPDLGEFGHLALAQLIRVRAAPVLPDILGVRRDGGPTIDPLLEQQLPALAASVRVPVVGPLDVRFDPADVLAVRLAPGALAVTSARKLALVAPELGLVLRVAAVDHDIAAVALRADSDPPLGDYLSRLAARCVEQFGLARLRPHLPLAPQQPPEAPWLLAHVPADTSKPVRVRAELPAGAGLRLERRPDALELRAEAPLQLVPEGTGLLADVALLGLRWRPAVAALELLSQPPAGPLFHEVLRRAFARFAPEKLLAELLRRLALPAAAPIPPPLPVAPGVVVWEQTFGALGAVRVTADQARTVDLSLRRGGAHIGFGKGATVRVLGLGLHVTVRTVDLTFLPWTLEVDASPPAGELAQHLLSHAMRALFAEFMRHFWPSDRSPRAGHDTLLAVGADKPWGPLKICVARGGSIDLHLDKEGVSLRSAAGLFVTGEALDWLPDFYLHDLSLRARDAAVKLSISGIAEEHYHEAAAVSPVTEAVLSHLYKVLAAPKLPAVWAQRLGLPRPPLPPAPPDDPTLIAVFSARLPGDYGEFALLMDPADTVTLTASEIEVAVESERGLTARMPGLRLAIQLRGARYHLQSGEVQVGGLGQLENALVEALVRRQIGDPADPGASGVRGVLDRFPVDDRGRLILFHHSLVDVLLLPGTSVRLRLDDRGLKIGADPALVVDGPARLNFLVCGLRYSFGDARFSIDFEGDTVVADLFEKIVDARAEKRLNDRLLPLLPAAMRTPGYRLSTDPQVRANIAALLRSFTRRKRTS
ncbi:hypothetical protein SAMN02745121_00429 [Nannocystis exedens]|uniref:Uncharacterized protein n=1 Tax=Nannocystis exedens TaxID=54 RepID=A0A1I1T1G2_9BACT|nr:hypothetical protein [Nannocystis exedens]PCC66842.1 hypothetical protein NAEX_09438 [Nannocystis exedens]SFD52517.1 hypothetical protein SAMN02745121_00429 [Nannocystis exedens]